MPAKGSKDMSKYTSRPREIDTKKVNKTLRSQLDASAAYDAKVDNIRLRLKKGMKEKMQNYVQSTGKYASVNAMITDLIEKELGIK